MTTTDILKWIDQNLKEVIDQAIEDSKKANPNLIYTPDLLIAMTYRETGELIAKRIGEGFKVPEIWAHMTGDYTQRKGESQPHYHGFGLIQIDIASFPEFINSGDWKDPYKCYMMAIKVLEGKRKILEAHFPKLGGEELLKATVAAYNCGEGNEISVITQNKDIDAYTCDHNYSADVWSKRAIYLNITKLQPAEAVA